MKSKIILFIVVSLIIVTIYFSFHKDERGFVLKPEIVRERNIKLNDIYLGEKVHYDMKIKSNLPYDAMLLGVTECGCLDILFSPQKIASNDKGIVSFVYDSTKKMESIGMVRQNFVIRSYDKSLEKSLAHFSGAVELNVKPSIELNPNNLIWVHSRNSEVLSEKSIDIKNVSEFPVELKLNNLMHANLDFKVFPDSITLKPDESSKISVKLTSIPDKSQGDNITGVLFMTGNIIQTNKKIPITYKAGLNLKIQEVIYALPGSLILSKDNCEEWKTVKLIAPEGKKLNIVKISCTYGKFDSRVTNNKVIQLKFSREDSDNILNCKVSLDILLDDTIHQVDIPVVIS